MERDAGFCTSPRESPNDLARRSGVDGVADCASVLERARHGLRVDAGDIDVMSAAATAAYGGARRRTGMFARAFAWLRWPLA